MKLSKFQGKFWENDTLYLKWTDICRKVGNLRIEHLRKPIKVYSDAIVRSVGLNPDDGTICRVKDCPDFKITKHNITGVACVYERLLKREKK